MNVLQTVMSGGRETKIGSVGPYPLYVGSFQSLIESNNEVSDEIMDALFHLFSMRRPGVVAINAHTLTHILDGGARARSHYFVKRNIFENAREVVGPYLKGGNHWTFFHCSIVDRRITYLNSLGEQDEHYHKIAQHWSTFAAAKGYPGPWKRSKRNHTLQKDGVSCGVFTAVFAETFLGGEDGYITCPPIQEERERLSLLLLSSLGGFLVESALKVSDFHQAKRYLVTSDELQRRCSLPESYSANTVVAYLRKAKGQKRNIEEKLAELGVKPTKRTKLTSQCSKLCEDECSDLAGDIMYLATKFIPQKKVGQALMESGNVHAAMAKTEDCRKTLDAVKNALEANWETFDLSTHGLGPAVIKGTFALIDACLKEKMRALKSIDYTDE
ncbi:transcription factor AP-2-epsilon-like [Brachyhypopomus gauderio]|uniref:transcription factor AP-2-epsilon-like n=1 Tax=Brachyhypopomus gauderio TaxID=698409 RepID=UPI00404201F0